MILIAHPRAHADPASLIPHAAEITGIDPAAFVVARDEWSESILLAGTVQTWVEHVCAEYDGIVLAGWPLRRIGAWTAQLVRQALETGLPVVFVSQTSVTEIAGVRAVDSEDYVAGWLLEGA